MLTDIQLKPPLIHFSSSEFYVGNNCTLSLEIELGIAHMRDYGRGSNSLLNAVIVPSIDGVAYAVMRPYSNNLNPLRLLVV